jgi:hypothetical protein
MYQIIGQKELGEIKEIAIALVQKDSRAFQDGPINRDLFLLEAFRRWLIQHKHPINFEVKTK